MRAAAGDKKYDNPKLEKMKHMISDYYKENSDSRCIIFCKTREMATALVNWMNETPELQPLNPTKLVGTNAPANREGYMAKEFLLPKCDFGLNYLATETLILVYIN